MTEAWIVDALRTPIGKHRGGLSRVRVDDLAARTISALLERNPNAKDVVEEVIFGATNQAGEDNRNIARMAAMLAGLPFEVSGVTVNRLCGSGLEAIVQVSRAIRLDDHEVCIAGGAESMSRAPYAMSKAEEPFPRKPPKIYDTSLGWRFQNPKMEERFPLMGMGMTAEMVAERYKVSREDQDAFAVESQRKATQAAAAGAFDNEIVSVTVPPANRKAKETLFEADESIRSGTTLEALARLRTVFKEGGTVTAGNASPLNDGSSALLMCSDRWGKANNVKPMARVVATGVAGVDPSYMGTGPIPATRSAIKKSGLKMSDIGLVELNEAFASQSLACVRELEIDPSIVNVNGGAIALGHPIGCSGARIVATLVHAMHKRDVRYGLATLCIGVGQGLAVIVEKL